MFTSICQHFEEFKQLLSSSAARLRP